jgi:hypothetical protein
MILMLVGGLSGGGLRIGTIRAPVPGVEMPGHGSSRRVATTKPVAFWPSARVGTTRCQPKPVVFPSKAGNCVKNRRFRPKRWQITELYWPVGMPGTMIPMPN